MTKKTYEVQRDEWYTALISEPSRDFLLKVSSRLGKIKTPYNKQHLLEQLESRLRTQGTQDEILEELDDIDKAVLSVACFAPFANMAAFHDILHLMYPIQHVRVHINHLESIFVLYRNSEGVYCVTPPLQKAVRSVVDIKDILAMEVLGKSKWIRWQDFDRWTEDVKKEGRLEEPITEMEIAALIAFVMAHKKVLKSDGSFTIQAGKDAAKQFGCDVKCLEYLLNCMIYLDLVNDDGALQFNWKALAAFAKLPCPHQAAYLSASPASIGIPSMLKPLSQMLLDCDATARGMRIEAHSLKTLAILFTEGDCRRSRYSMPPNKTTDDTEWDDEDEYENWGDLSIPEKLVRTVNAASYFGFAWISDDGIYRLCFGGGEKTGDVKETPAPPYGDAEKPPSPSTPLASIDASFTVTVMPGMRLESILPLLPFLELVSYQTAAEFVITKESAIRAFDAGFEVNDAVQSLKKCTGQEVSDSLMVSLESWYETYKSATLYLGYVLQLTQTAARRFECSPSYEEYVTKKLSDGVYLLNVSAASFAANDNAALKILNRSGFKSALSVKAVQDDSKPPALKSRSFPLLHEGRNLLDTL